MLADRTTKVILTIIAVFLGVIAFRPLVEPTSVKAQSSAEFAHIIAMTDARVRLRNGTFAKPFLDSRNGNRWVCTFDQCYTDGRYPFEQMVQVPDEESEN